MSKENINMSTKYYKNISGKVSGTSEEFLNKKKKEKHLPRVLKIHQKNRE